MEREEGRLVHSVRRAPRQMNVVVYLFQTEKIGTPAMTPESISGSFCFVLFSFCRTFVYSRACVFLSQPPRPQLRRRFLSLLLLLLARQRDIRWFVPVSALAFFLFQRRDTTHHSNGLPSAQSYPRYGSRQRVDERKMQRVRCNSTGEKAL